MFDESAPTWEYRVEQLSQIQVANQLNFMGKEGWELVSVIHSPDAEYPYECFFKRSLSGRF